MSRASLFRRPLLAFAIALALGGAVAGCSNPKADQAVRAALKRELGQGIRWFRRPTVDVDDVQPIVRRFYRGRKHRPAWTHARGPKDEARDLTRILHEADHEGLDPRLYGLRRIDSLMKATDVGLIGPSPPPRLLARLDLILTRAFLTYSAHRSTGQVNPRVLPDWHIPPRRVDLDSVLTEALNRHDVRRTLSDLVPKHPQYMRLRDALAQYRAIETRGGWRRVPPGPALRLGRRGPRVLRLRERLAATGDLPPGAGRTAVFDALTLAGVKRFQSRHGLDPDGVVGSDELEELNLPVGHRIRQIELNMERWRWMRPLGDRYVMVNIPDFTLRVVEGGRPVMTMRVVVGKRYRRTPIFSDSITYVVINPSWNVPPSIAGQEILPELQRDPGYLAANSIRVFTADAKTEVNPASVDWNSIDPEDVPYLFRQDPGPWNALGHVKFVGPNQFDVYLHDTPAGHLFNAEGRDFSHGCVRVERPFELAAYLLRGRPHSSPEDIIIAAFNSEARDSAVKLPRAMPVHILYWTAWVDDSGTLNFRDDVYGLDQALERTLRQAVPVAARIGLRRESEWIACSAPRISDGPSRHAEVGAGARHRGRGEPPQGFQPDEHLPVHVLDDAVPEPCRLASRLHVCSRPTSQSCPGGFRRRASRLNGPASRSASERRTFPTG